MDNYWLEIRKNAKDSLNHSRTTQQFHLCNLKLLQVIGEFLNTVNSATVLFHAFSCQCVACGQRNRSLLSKMWLQKAGSSVNDNDTSTYHSRLYDPAASSIRQSMITYARNFIILACLLHSSQLGSLMLVVIETKAGHASGLPYVDRNRPCTLDSQMPG